MSRIAVFASSVSASGCDLEERLAVRVERADVIAGQLAERRVVVMADGEQLLILERRHRAQL